MSWLRLAVKFCLFVVANACSMLVHQMIGYEKGGRGTEVRFQCARPVASVSLYGLLF